MFRSLLLFFLLLVSTLFTNAHARDTCIDLREQMNSYYDDGVDEYNTGIEYLSDAKRALKKEDEKGYCRRIDDAADEFDSAAANFSDAIETGRDIAFECSNRLSDYAFSKLEKNIHRNRVNRRKALKRYEKYSKISASKC